MLKDVFVFSQCQEKGTFGLGYKLTLTKNIDNAVLKKDNAINNAKIKNNAKEWYVPHYTPSISNEAILSKQTLSRPPTDIQHVEKSVFFVRINYSKFMDF